MFFKSLWVCNSISRYIGLVSAASVQKCDSFESKQCDAEGSIVAVLNLVTLIITLMTLISILRMITIDADEQPGLHSPSPQKSHHDQAAPLTRSTSIGQGAIIS